MQHSQVMSGTREAIAGAVRAELARRRISQQELADLGTGLSSSALSRRLNGDVDFTVTELVALANAMGASPLGLLSAAINGVPGEPGRAA